MTTNQNTRLGKQHIIEVAEQLFTEHGYQAVSIRDISQACGVSNAALYYHFPSKEALFEEAAERHADKLAHRMRKASTQASNTKEKLNLILKEYANLVAERRSPLFSLRGKPDKIHPEQAKKHHTHLIKRVLAPIDETLQVAVNRGEIRQLPDNQTSASLLLGLFHGMLQHHKHLANSGVTESDIQLVIDIFLNGMKL